MSDMIIEIVANPINTVPTAKGSYQVIELAYKNKSFQDKLEGKKVMSFTNKDVFKVLSEAKFGDVFTVSRVKNDKGFWDWTAVNIGGGGNSQTSNTPAPVSANRATAPVGNASPKSTYETAEERAARQILIVRQSSINAAVEFGAYTKLKETKEIIAVAKEFEAFVFGQNVAVEKPVATNKMDEPPANFFEDLDNDFPE